VVGVFGVFVTGFVVFLGFVVFFVFESFDILCSGVVVEV